MAVADPLQCGGKLITEGVSKAEVVARCGQPTQVEHELINNSLNVPIGPMGLLPGNVKSETKRDIETWTHNFGPDRFLERIRFENGVVVELESKGYGY